MCSSKNNYVLKVYKTKLGNFGQRNNMDECLQFALFSLKIFTVSEKFYWASTIHFFTIPAGHASSLRHILDEIPSVSAHRPTSFLV